MTIWVNLYQVGKNKLNTSTVFCDGFLFFFLTYERYKDVTVRRDLQNIESFIIIIVRCVRTEYSNLQTHNDKHKNLPGNINILLSQY